jgi:hypothetical protein
MKHRRLRKAVHGAALSLLLALLVLGLLVWLAWRALHGTVAAPSAQDSASCEQRLSQLVATTGGVGPQAKAAYDRLPPDCRRLMPDPAALVPSPERADGPAP